MGRLDDKVTVITGAAGGIGRAAAKLFAAEGSKVMLVDIQEDMLSDMVKEIGNKQAAYAVADVSAVSDVQNYITKTQDLFGQIDISLLNAGIEGKIASIQEQTDQDFDRVLAVNTRGVWLGLKYTMPVMAGNGGGSIVITSSTAGIRATPGLSPYITSKHAVIGLMRAGAMEGAPDKIRVNTVNPSPIETNMIYRIEDKINPDRGNKQPMADNTPLRRYGQPEEVARLMLFLGSDDGSFCTGGVYMCDGGVSGGRSYVN
ncbi:MAG: oxidoreductase [Rhodospirillaceae bacterium]|nr:oxidoreductase [Rhodospirillaceae bacterium]|tara:strand:- start:342 stop:1118 length:777 start_codon:yes stop_codon:yes gene_type:complete